MSSRFSAMRKPTARGNCGVFLNDTNTVVAVVSFGNNGNCKGADYSARVDVADARDFILPFVGD